MLIFSFRLISAFVIFSMLSNTGQSDAASITPPPSASTPLPTVQSTNKQPSSPTPTPQKAQSFPQPVAQTFYVVTDVAGDASASGMKTILATQIASELNKDQNGQQLRDPANAQLPIWTIPEPGWDDAALLSSCSDTTTIGGVILTTTINTEDHFFIALAEEITDVQAVAQIVSCDQDANGVNSGHASLVGLIWHLSGAPSSPWVIRQIQIGVPLIGIAGLASLWSKNENTKNITIPLAAAAVLGNVGNQTVPGYLVPIRERRAAKHVGDDLKKQLNQFCKSKDPLAAPPLGLKRICSIFKTE